MTLEEYAQVICAILDVPIHNHNIIEALYTLFTALHENRTNQYELSS